MTELAVGRVLRAAHLADEWAVAHGYDVLVHASPGSVAWATGGANLPIDRTAGVDLVWAVHAGGSVTLITTEIEAPRLAAEYDLDAHGVGLVAVPWYDPDAFAQAARQIAAGGRIAGDGAVGDDHSDELVALRMTLGRDEQQALAELCHDAARALEDALLTWTPGESDTAIAGRIAGALEATGADTPCLIVGGDERVERFRHPLQIGAPVSRLVMAVVVARRGGLHAAATRMASNGPISDDLVRRRIAVAHVEAATLSAMEPGATYGQVIDTLGEAYAAVGAPGAWAEHYQGGPIGYAQREFEIAPAVQSPWRAAIVRTGQAVAWNPSLSGGAKCEDTYLVTGDGLRRLTIAGPWPDDDPTDGYPPRPGVLDLTDLRRVT